VNPSNATWGQLKPPTPKQPAAEGGQPPCFPSSASALALERRTIPTSTIELIEFQPTEYRPIRDSAFRWLEDVRTLANETLANETLEKEVIFQNGEEYRFVHPLRKVELFRVADKNFAVSHFLSRSYTRGLTHVIEHHLLDSIEQKGVFDLSAILELFDPVTKTHLHGLSLQFGRESFQWKSAVLYMFLKSCLSDYKAARIVKHNEDFRYGVLSFCFFVELPTAIGWVQSLRTSDGSKVTRVETRYVEIVFNLKSSNHNIFFSSAYPISEAKFLHVTNGANFRDDYPSFDVARRPAFKVKEIEVFEI
jgi:hypothetical protein